MRWLLIALMLVAGNRADGAPPDLEQQARSHFRTGSEFFKAGDYEHAIGEYEAAYRLAQRPKILFDIAQAYRLKGDGPKAREYYERYLAEKPTGTLSDEARTHLRELEPAPPPPSPTPPPPAQLAEPTPAPLPTDDIHTLPSPALPTAQESPQAAPHRSRKWVWAVVAGGAALVAVGLGVGLGVGLSHRERDPDATFGTVTVK